VVNPTRMIPLRLCAFARNPARSLIGKRAGAQRRQARQDSAINSYNPPFVNFVSFVVPPTRATPPKKTFVPSASSC
jgi:hypothetical protein